MTSEEWTRTLAPFAKDHLTEATVEGDTASLMFSVPFTDASARIARPPKPGLAQYKACFHSPVLAKDTVLFEAPGTVLRNRAGSSLWFSPSYGLLRADIVDGLCRWNGTLQVGMSKQDVLHQYFNEALDTRLFAHIALLYLPSGMNLNGVYLTFKEDKLVRIVESEIPD